MPTIIHTLYGLILILMAASCVCSPECKTEPLNSIGGIYQSSTTGRLSKDEFYVISNPPKDTLELLRLMDAFNQRTLPKDSLLKYLPGSYYRAFYNKESRLYRDYMNDARFDIDRTYDYANERLLTFRWHADICCPGIQANYASAVYNFSFTRFNISPDSLYNFWMNDNAWK